MHTRIIIALYACNTYVVRTIKLYVVHAYYVCIRTRGELPLAGQPPLGSRDIFISWLKHGLTVLVSLHCKAFDVRCSLEDFLGSLTGSPCGGSRWLTSSNVLTTMYYKLQCSMRHCEYIICISNIPLL
jgi:hypothetical protein